MGAIVQASTPAFTRLPVELLAMILDQRYSNESLTWWVDIIDSSTLRSLRLACRQYAYLARLLEKLFHSIRLVASPEHVHLAESLDLSLIKPHVKRIVMEPTKYSWNMTEDIFEDIVLITPLQEHCYQMDQKAWEIMKAGGDVSKLTVLGREQFAELGMRGFVQQYMDGKMPFSDTEIREGFGRYMQHARRTHYMFETEQVQHAWTKVLTQLPGVHSFRIGSWNFNGRGQSNWKDLGCEVHQHEHYCAKIHNKAVCQRLQEPVGEALFSAAIASLVAARSDITQLDIQCVVDNDFAWADNGELDDLDLSRLQILSFQPLGTENEDPGTQGAVATRCSLAITTLLRKCSTSLRKLDLFSYTSACPMAWPPPSIPASPDLAPLPALSSFTTSLSLRLSAFALFLHQSPALTHLQLDGCYEYDGEWRDLWDAIRTHPNRMRLEFDKIACHSAPEVSIYHHTGEASKAEFHEDPWDNIQYSLENYLSARRHWDRSLRMWFEDGDEEPTDEEEEEEVLESTILPVWITQLILALFTMLSGIDLRGSL